MMNLKRWIKTPNLILLKNLIQKVAKNMMIAHAVVVPIKNVGKIVRKSTPLKFFRKNATQPKKRIRITARNRRASISVKPRSIHQIFSQKLGKSMLVMATASRNTNEEGRELLPEARRQVSDGLRINHFFYPSCFYNHTIEARCLTRPSKQQESLKVIILKKWLDPEILNLNGELIIRFYSF